jgi:hypothetical protein
MFIVAGLLDAVPIIGVAVALLLLYANPFLGALGGSSIQGPTWGASGSGAGAGTRSWQ